MNIVTQVASLAKIISTEILLPNFAKVKIDLKADGSWLTVADQLAHDRLLEELPKLKDLPVLSEESSIQDQQQILANKCLSYWCIDPLDGTSNFAQGIPYWCVSIALIVNGETVLGVVYDPNRDECFSATSGSPSRLNGQRLTTNEDSKQYLSSCMGLIDFKRLDEKKIIALIYDKPYRSQRSFGASALDLCWIAAARCQVYLHGKQSLWDYAAGLFILEKSQGRAETFDAESVMTNELQSKSVIAASNQYLMGQWKNYFHSI